ncbi:MAG: hypothetical protein ABIA59_02420 [Candidatus Latescibacterota bacterium]
MNRLRIPALVMLCLFLMGTAEAQTDYSLRVLSLSPHLAAIVDDPLTDIYLNPARLGLFDRALASGVWLPRKTIRIPFPMVSNYRDMKFGPIEDDMRSFDYAPLAFSYIRPHSEGIMFAAGMQITAAGDNYGYASPSYDLDEWGTQQTLGQRVNGYERGDETTHLLLDLAAASRSEKSVGLRLTASHTSYRYNRVNSWSTITIDLNNMADMSIYEDFAYEFIKYEETDVGFSIGTCRPEERLTDVSVGASLCRRLHSINTLDRTIADEDADRNGQRIGGGSPDLNVYQDRHDSNRDYLGLRLFARAHWDVWKDIRAVHEMSLQRTGGDGRTEFISDDLYYSAVFDIDKRAGGYQYDGSTSDLAISTAVGYNLEIHERFIATFGLKGIFSRWSFDEDGEGDASVLLDQSNGTSDSLYTSSAYTQKHDNDQTRFTLVMPVGCEWQAHDFVTLRVGMEVIAYHIDEDNSLQRSVAAIDLPPKFKSRSYELGYDGRYATRAQFNNGIEITIRDKLIIDLLAFASHSSYIGLDNYGYASVRYLF